MIDQVNSKISANALNAMRALTLTTARMPESTRALWTTRFEHVYGDLSGQRAVDVDALGERLGSSRGTYATHDILFGVQTYFSILSDLIAAASAHRSPAQFLDDAARLPQSSFASFLRNLSSGRLLASLGIFGASTAFDFDWYVDALDYQGEQALREVVKETSSQLEPVDLHSNHDLVSVIYQSLLPRNLRHVLGEFYTPTWLAELLLIDCGWKPGQSLLDPFGGSGVFALAALRIARAMGVDPLTVLPDLAIVDLNPFACAAARASLIVALHDRVTSDKRIDVNLPVLSGDALVPALTSTRAASRQTLFPEPLRVSVDGELVTIPLAADGMPDLAQVTTALAHFGLHMPRWIDTPLNTKSNSGQVRVSERRFWEQLAILALRPADVVATNPPWVGWEYMSRPYRAYLDPAWTTYGLFTAKGRDASFIKEDLSTLALITAWDRYLRPGGTSVAVVRANVMTSTLAAQGLRRLSVFSTSDAVRLERIRLFEGLRIFQGAQVATATWQITKGEKTDFPVRVTKMRGRNSRSQLRGPESLDQVLQELQCEEAVAERIAPADVGSRWVIGSRDCVLASRQLVGTSAYLGRTGVFTGGANAVYYLRREDAADTGNTPYFRNVIERAKRGAPSVRVRLETSLVYEVVRGRDLTRWSSRSELLMLVPHTREGRMRALPPDEMQSLFPRAWSYLNDMRPVLDARKGFTEWERQFREEAFYAIQRIGDYTFAPYKVAWRYIATDFLVAVIGPDLSGRPRLPNDKVMFVGLDDPEEAYYLCGVLSSDPVRWKIVAYSSGTQISANVIEPIGVPGYDAENRLHAEVASSCRMGHIALLKGRTAEAAECLERVNASVAEMWNIDAAAMALFRQELAGRHGMDWPPLRSPESAVALTN